MRKIASGAALVVALSSAAWASETITYSYDVLGRLTGEVHGGSVNNGVSGAIAYDPAGNRTGYAVTGSGVALSIADSSIDEGNDLIFTVTRTGVSSTSFSVNYQTAPGTATSNVDYATKSGTLTFAPSDLTKTITVPTLVDNTPESNETLTVTLSNAPANVTLTRSTATGTIIEGAASAARFSIGNASVTEGGSLVFTVTKSGTTASTLSVNYATANGTAAAPSDYTAASGTLVFGPSETSKTISVSTIDDAALEPTEAMAVNLSGASAGATISQSQGSGSIVDNDAAPVAFSIAAPAQVTEGGTLIFTVTKSGTTSSTLSVNYATADGTAIAPNDYAAASGTLVFGPSETSKTISVSTFDDLAPEPTETMAVNLSGASAGATISQSQAGGVIGDNDVTPIAFSIATPAQVTEGAPLVFTVTRSGKTYATTSVNYATADGTAVAGSDYSAASGTLSFGPSETSKTITVGTIDDTVPELPETTSVNLSGASGGTIATSQAIGTINDNDAANSPPVTQNDTGRVARCDFGIFNVVVNDTDPEGDYPLTVVSVGGSNTFTVASSTSVKYDNGGQTAGTKVGIYTVRDARGATATGQITITVPSGACSQVVGPG